MQDALLLWRKGYSNMIVLLIVVGLAIVFCLFASFCFFMVWRDGAWKHGLSLLLLAVVIAAIAVIIL